MYEISSHLKALYKHWEYHTIEPQSESHESTLDVTTLSEMNYFISERMSIWDKKQKNISPTTKDLILANYRFCNVYRELDKQTIQIHTQLQSLLDDFPLWLLNIIFSRMVCRPETINNTGLLSFSVKNNELVYKKLLDLPSPKYGTAYVFPVSAIMKSEYPTRELFFTQYLPLVAEKCASIIASQKRASVIKILSEVLTVFGFNFYFHFTEVLIDVAYQFPRYLDLYADFPIGPGAMPTMKLLQSDMDPVAVCRSLVTSKYDTSNLLSWNGLTLYLSTENWEGIGCESRKYRNLKNGAGRQRKYSGG
jgi:hypothetical protein